MALFRSAFIPAILACSVTGAFSQGYVSRRPAKPTVNWNIQNQVNWSPLLSGPTSLLTNPAIQVMNNDAEMQMYWIRSMGQAPASAPRNVDWLNRKVVAINLGPRPSGGYSVFVQSVEKTGMFAIVHAVEVTPLPNQRVSRDQTSPYILITIDRTAAKVQYDLTSQCGFSTGITIYGDGSVGAIPCILPPSAYDTYVDPQYAPGPQDENPTILPWDGEGGGDNSAFPDSGVYPIGSEGEWNQYVKAVTGQPSTVPSNCDWSRFQMVAIHLGRRPSEGYSLQVKGVKRAGATGIINVVEIAPDPARQVGKQSTFPFTVIRVPRGATHFSLNLTHPSK
jgi:hypothetical protein